MTKNEIQTVLAEPHDLFYIQEAETGVIYITFSVAQEADLIKCAKALKHVLDNADNYIEINKTTKGPKYQVIISSPTKGTVITFETPVSKYDYNELLLAKAHDDQVAMGFYIPQKEILPTKADIRAIKKDPNYDEAGAVTAEQAHYVPVKIAVELCLFKIKSADSYQDESAFVDIKPEIALAVSEELRSKNKDREA
jgi:hypothetical protein